MVTNLMLILGAVAPEKFPKAAKVFEAECDKILREQIARAKEKRDD